MLTPIQMLYGLALPAGVALVLAAVGRWLRWRWVMPLAAGGAFLAAYAALGISTLPPYKGDLKDAAALWAYAVQGMPKFPPANGTDWLFWLAMPVTVIGLLDAILGGRWGWVLGASAGAVALGTLRPLFKMMDPVTFWATVAALTLVGPLLVWVASVAERRAGAIWSMGALAATLAGAGVLVMSSNLQTVGIYGLSAAAAVAPVALVAGRELRASRSVAVVGAPLLAGLLVAGRYYTEPGVPLAQGLVMLGAPVLLLAGAFLPVRREWVRGLVGLVAVIITVAAVAGPAALSAKRAAEADPYAGYR